MNKMYKTPGRKSIIVIRDKGLEMGLVGEASATSSEGIEAMFIILLITVVFIYKKRKALGSFK